MHQSRNHSTPERGTIPQGNGREGKGRGREGVATGSVGGVCGYFQIQSHVSDGAFGFGAKA